MAQTRTPTPTEKLSQDQDAPLPKENFSEGRQDDAVKELMGLQTSHDFNECTLLAGYPALSLRINLQIGGFGEQSSTKLSFKYFSPFPSHFPG